MGPNPASHLFLQISFTGTQLHLFTVYGRFLATKGEISSCRGDCLAHKGQRINHVALYRKSLLTLALEDRVIKSCNKNSRVLLTLSLNILCYLR